MRVVIAEDSVLLREGIARLLSDSGCAIVAAVGDGPALVAAIVAHRPDIAIVDETKVVELDSRIAGAAAAQARPERGGARAMGKRRQAGQAAAQATSRLEGIDRSRRNHAPGCAES